MTTHPTSPDPESGIVECECGTWLENGRDANGTKHKCPDPVPEPMEEGAAVELAARAIRDADLTGCDNIWTLWAKAALNAAYPALLAENERLRDRIDEILPPLKPDFQAIMERLDAEVERLAAYENSETGKMSTPAASRSRTLEIIHTARHLVRYANDAEAGNAALLVELTRLRGIEELAREMARVLTIPNRHIGQSLYATDYEYITGLAVKTLAALDTP